LNFSKSFVLRGIKATLQKISVKKEEPKGKDFPDEEGKIFLPRKF